MKCGLLITASLGFMSLYLCWIICCYQYNRMVLFNFAFIKSDFYDAIVEAKFVIFIQILGCHWVFLLNFPTYLKTECSNLFALAYGPHWLILDHFNPKIEVFIDPSKMANSCFEASYVTNCQIEGIFHVLLNYALC